MFNRQSQSREVDRIMKHANEQRSFRKATAKNKLVHCGDQSIAMTDCIQSCSGNEALKLSTHSAVLLLSFSRNGLHHFDEAEK